MVYLGYWILFTKKNIVSSKVGRLCSLIKGGQRAYSQRGHQIRILIMHLELKDLLCFLWECHSLQSPLSSYNSSKNSTIFLRYSSRYLMGFGNPAPKCHSLTLTIALLSESSLFHSFRGTIRKRSYNPYPEAWEGQPSTSPERDLKIQVTWQFQVDPG